MTASSCSRSRSASGEAAVTASGKCRGRGPAAGGQPGNPAAPVGGVRDPLDQSLLLQGDRLQRDGGRVGPYRDRGVRQVVALGFSNGGQLVIRVLRDAPDLLDGAVLVGATLPAAANLIDPAAQPRAVPMVLTHGTRDPIVPHAGGTASLFGFRSRGQMVSFAGSTRHWTGIAGLPDDPAVETLPRLHRSGTTTLRRTFRQAGRPAVIALTVEGGGHTVPHHDAPGRRITGRTSPDVDLLDELRRVR